MARLGLSLPLEGVSLDACIALAVTAEELGYSDVWTSEIGGPDGFTLLAAIAQRTHVLRLGTGVVSVFTRPPALLAMTAVALQELSGGRFYLGLGASTDTIVDQWMGLAYVRPLHRMRETIEAFQLASSGNRVSYDGELVSLRDFRLRATDTLPVPVLVGALGPRMLALAGELADGVMLSQAAFSSLPVVLADVRRGAEAAGRDPHDVEVVLRVGVAIDEDEALLRPILQRELAAYARARGYAHAFARAGYGAEVGALTDAWGRGEPRAAVAAISEPLLADTYIWGTAAQCRARLRDYRAAGVDTPVIIPISAHSDAATRHLRRERVIRELAALAHE